MHPFDLRSGVARNRGIIARHRAYFTRNSLTWRIVALGSRGDESPASLLLDPVREAFSAVQATEKKASAIAVPTPFPTPWPSGPVISPDPGCEATFRMPGGHTSPLAELLDLLERKTYPVRDGKLHSSINPCPADKTKRSWSNHVVLEGLCLRKHVHKTYAKVAAPIGKPGVCCWLSIRRRLKKTDRLDGQTIQLDR